MVSAMTATTASVSPSCQDTRIENATITMTAMTARSCQVRILGSADKWARFPRCWPMPGDRGLPSASSTGVTTGFHSGLAGPPSGGLVRRIVRRHGLPGRGPVPQGQVGRLGLGRLDFKPRIPSNPRSSVASATSDPTDPAGPVGSSPADPAGPGHATGVSATGSAVPRAREPNLPEHPAVPPCATVPRRVLPRCDCLRSSAALMTCFSALATPSGITHHLSVTALGLSAKHRHYDDCALSGLFYSWTFVP